MTDLLQPLRNTGDDNIFSLRREIEELMWDKGGVVRSAEGLASAWAGLDYIAQCADPPAVLEYNMAWQEWINLRSLLTVAQLACVSGLTRQESRGSHYRSDFPETDNEN